MDITVTVQVLDGDQLIETRRCRSVRLPDGRDGAIWRGLAYALRNGTTIDAADTGIEPVLCYRGERPTSPRSYAVVKGVEEAWLLLAGNGLGRDVAVTQLHAAGVKVIRTGRWLGDPVDGFDADWFVRFEIPPGDQDVDARLEQILNLAPVAAPTEAALSIRVLETEIATLYAREAALRAEIGRLGATAREANSRGANVDAVRAELDQERALRQAAEARVEASTRATTDAPMPSREVPVQTAPPRLPPRRALLSEIETVVDTLLPRTSLLRDSMTIASAEFRARTGLYRALSELNQTTTQLPPNWKRVRGADDWWERHVSTGEDDSGRLYARFSSISQRWEVLLSHKSEQDRDILWLRRNR